LTPHPFYFEKNELSVWIYIYTTTSSFSDSCFTS